VWAFALIVPFSFLPALAGEIFATENCDANGDGRRDASDASFILSWLFLGGPPPIEEPSPSCRAKSATECAPQDARACLYRPRELFDAVVLPQIILEPAHRRGPVELPDEELPDQELTVLPITVTVPDGAIGPLPVVIWSHGGGSRPSPRASGEIWARTFARSGYVSIAGHSVGTNAVLFLAGGERNIFPPGSVGSLFHEAPDPRPKVFLPMSPPGADSAGWTSESLETITRPVLTATGAADIRPDFRIEPHEAFSPGDKLCLYLDSPYAAHSIFQLKSPDGSTSEERERQEPLIQIVASAGIAFLDAYLKDCEDAQEWLHSNEPVTAIERVTKPGGLAPPWSVK